MKLVEAIYNVDRSLANQDGPAHIEGFENVLGIGNHMEYDYDQLENRLVAYWLKRRNCTDTWVGVRVYFLDHKLIAVGHQTARKNPNKIEFISQEAAFKVRDFILSMRKHEADEYPVISEQDLEQEIGEYYNVNYYGDFLTKQGLYQGRAVKIVDTGHHYIESGRTFVMVCYTDDEQKPFLIPVKEFCIPWHVNTETQDYD